MKLSDETLQKVNLTKEDFHGEWNYSIAPTFDILSILFWYDP
jgi:hypothetical protein